jgi:hypothetical protein
MKASGQKLKKVKTRQVYGFKKEQSIVGYFGGETTATTTTTVSGAVLPM